MRDSYQEGRGCHTDRRLYAGTLCVVPPLLSFIDGHASALAILLHATRLRCFRDTARLESGLWRPLSHSATPMAVCPAGGRPSRCAEPSGVITLEDVSKS